MSMGFDFLQSSPSDQGIDLDIGDLKLQYNAALEELSFVSVSFESYMDACNRVFALFDAVEANEGMLDPVVRDFVNRNGELSMALGIDLAMEDDSQDAQKQNGEKVTEKKQGFFRRVWEAIKKFVRWILDKIGSFFHWLGNLFAGTKKKMEWVLHDGIKVAEEFAQLPKEQQDAITKEGLSATLHKKEGATEAFEMGSIYPNQKTQESIKTINEHNYEIHQTNDATLPFCHFDQLGAFLEAYSKTGDKFYNAVNGFSAAVHNVLSVNALTTVRDIVTKATRDVVEFVNNTDPKILPTVRLNNDGTISFQVPKAIRCDTLDHTNIFKIRSNGFIDFAEKISHMGSAESYLDGIKKGLYQLDMILDEIPKSIETAEAINISPDYINAAKDLKNVIKSQASFAAGICATYGKFCKSVFESASKSYKELRNIEKAMMQTKEAHRIEKEQNQQQA